MSPRPADTPTDVPANDNPANNPADNSVALVTLGCARNEVDSEELAGRLEADGWTLVGSPADASVIVVNTCGFVEAAKKDSIDTLLEAGQQAEAAKASGRAQAVVAVGCLAERYGATLAGELPEADAVLGFDDYAHIADRLRDALAGQRHTPHVPRDRRTLLPLSPVRRQGARPAPPGHAGPGHAGPDRAGPDQAGPDQAGGADLPEGVAPPSGPRPLRRRLDAGPVAPLKLASGCDRRCSFCAIPSFRGSFLSRRPTELLAEARWLAERGVREIVLVSENSTSYGKDLGDLRLLETLLPELAALDGIRRVRVNYLQPAEMRPGLVEVIATTPGVAPYFDLSFQHSSGSVLRRMRRFGDTEVFLGLLAQIREHAPEAGVRSNFIVGFPGETEPDVEELERFLAAARLDAIGVFGYSDEDGTEAAGFGGKHPEEVVRERVERIAGLADELTGQRAEERIGEMVEVLIERPASPGRYEGRAAHQAPETDGTTTLTDSDSDSGSGLATGDLVLARVTGTTGVDLVASTGEVLR